MPAPGLWDNLAGLVVTPVAMWVIAAGLGLLAERATGARLPNALIPPLGLCVAVVLFLGLAVAHLHGTVVTVILIVAVLAGFALARRELPGRLNAGWALAAAVAAYLMFDASVIASGHWTFSGYHLQDDTAYEMLLAAHIQAHGTALVALPASTASLYVKAFLQTGYPLGGQSVLAALSGLMHINVAVVYQGFLSSFAAIGAMAASTICGDVYGPRLRALVGVLAMGAALTFQYALQGSIKEVVTAVAVLCALALIRHAILELRSYAAAAIVAIPLAAILCAYNAAALPYVLALAGTSFVAAVLVHRRLPRSSWVRPTVAGVALFGILAASALSTLSAFLHTVQNGYVTGAVNAIPLGQLLRPLPLSELNGIWLTRDYRIMVPPGTLAELEVVASVAMLVLLAVGFAHSLVRREPGVAIGVATMGLVLLIVYPRSIPYAQAKLLAIASPVVVLGAAYGIAALRAWRRTALAASVLGAALGVGILGSDALAYHGSAVAPTGQMIALEQVGKAIGPHGPVLDSEFQEFSKFFAQPARIDAGTEYPTTVNLELRVPGGLYGQSFDLDAELLPFVESFPYIVVRRSPAASRPPANFRRIFQNYYYSVWKRGPTPRVIDHLPLQQLYSGQAPVSCTALAQMVAHAPAGSRLEVSYLPAMLGYDVLHATVKSLGWPQDPAPYVPDAVAFETPGVAGTVIRVKQAGNYRIWLQGSTPRVLRVTLNGKTVSHLGYENSPGEWMEGASVHLRPGRYAFDVYRPGGSLAPGDGGTGEAFQGRGEIGYLALAPDQQPRLVSMPRSSWRTLCGRQADWVELVSGG